MRAGAVRRKTTSRRGAAARPVSRGHNDRIIVGIVCIFLAATVWIVFGQTLGHEFVNYDDGEYVYENPQITAGLTPRGIQWAFTHVHSGNWHPLTTISHMLDCQFYGVQPWGHHFTNVLLHAAAAIFLFLALRELTGRSAGSAWADNIWPCAVVAALFAIHPLRVESVAWVSERKDVLSGVFFMLVLWSYAHYARDRRRNSRKSWRWYIAAILLFALGLMCKPALVTTPFVLLLLDYWPLRRAAASRGGLQRRSRARTPSSWQAAAWLHLIVEKIPFFVLSVASCVATVLAQKQAVITMRQLNFVQRIGNAILSYVVYLGQTVYPAHLSVVYPYPEGNLTAVQPLFACLLLLLISVIFFLLRKAYPFLVVGWLWFLGMLIPMIGIMQVGAQAHADRYTYLPQIGLDILTVFAAAALITKWRVRGEIAIVTAMLIIAGSVTVSCFQTSYWRNSETLWQQALANTSHNYIAENGIGSAFLQKGQLDTAASHFRKGLEIYPDYPEANNNLGYVFANQGNWADSVTFYQAALRARPNYAKAHNNLGVSLAATGKINEALTNFREALQIDESFVDARFNLAHALLEIGNRDEAMMHLREVLRLRPDDADVKEQLRQLGVIEGQ